VAPLFETLDDLHNAPGTIETLLGSQWYKNHISTHHDGVQECMIGECMWH
jgi:phosphoenolpyruvate carboxylase